jgi:hypothetical protein
MRMMYIFLVIAVGWSMAYDAGGTVRTVDFFTRHGMLFLACATFFPRLTLLFATPWLSSVFWWLGLVFCPRVLVAALATVNYVHTNPSLVMISWFVAAAGEFMEKRGIAGRKNFHFKMYRGGMGAGPTPSYPQAEPIPNKDDAIEAEFTKK